MKFKPIITSLLDTDFYKFTMGQVILHQYPSLQVTWTFKCRNEDVFFTPEMVEEIREQIKAYCNLTFTEEELDYLRKISFLKGNYIDFLSVYHPIFEHFTIDSSGENGISIEAKGPWFLTSYYEIPVLSIVNEVYFKMSSSHEEYLKLQIEQFKRLEDKLNKLRTGEYKLSTFSDFGTRRRFSCSTHYEIVKKIAEAQQRQEFAESTFIGTSNVMLAKEFNVKPIGTMAHEFIMAVGQGQHEYNPAYSNKFALDSWVKEYGTKNGIYLTDTIGTSNFLLDFNDHYSTVFSGVRHDSGDPVAWGRKMIAHYKQQGIDPMTKTLLFSDSLNFPKATKLYDELKDEAHIAFGIGTNITNDTGIRPINIVMKLTKVNGQPVAKVSDEPTKGMCKDKNYVEFLQRAIKWRQIHDKTSPDFIKKASDKLLIVVDMQNDFLDGALRNEDGIRIIPNVVAKIKEYKEKGYEIIATRDTHKTNYLNTQEGTKLPVTHCIKNTQGWEINSDVAKELGDALIFDKQAFGSPELVDYLLSNHNSSDKELTIELIGVCTDICVISNAMLIKSSFPEANISVDASCCAGVTKDSHKNALNAMKCCHINIIGE